MGTARTKYEYRRAWNPPDYCEPDRLNVWPIARFINPARDGASTAAPMMIRLAEAIELVVVRRAYVLPILDGPFSCQELWRNLSIASTTAFCRILRVHRTNTKGHSD
jgi:hypothetical protein